MLTVLERKTVDVHMCWQAKLVQQRHQMTKD